MKRHIGQRMLVYSFACCHSGACASPWPDLCVIKSLSSNRRNFTRHSCLGSRGLRAEAHLSVGIGSGLRYCLECRVAVCALPDEPASGKESVTNYSTPPSQALQLTLRAPTLQPCRRQDPSWSECHGLRGRAARRRVGSGRTPRSSSTDRSAPYFPPRCAKICCLHLWACWRGSTGRRRGVRDIYLILN